MPKKRGPAKAGPLGSLRADKVREIHEAVNLRAVRKEPDEIAGVVDPVDVRALYAEGCCLLRTWGIEVKMTPSETKPCVFLFLPSV
jgi:hypothetical protein